MPKTDTASAAAVFKLAGDPIRLGVLDALADQPRNVTALCELLGSNQPVISHHLAMLRISGLVECRRQGKTRVYALGGVGTTLVGLARKVFPADKA